LVLFPTRRSPVHPSRIGTARAVCSAVLHPSRGATGPVGRRHGSRSAVHEVRARLGRQHDSTLPPRSRGKLDQKIAISVRSNCIDCALERLYLDEPPAQEVERALAVVVIFPNDQQFLAGRAVVAGFDPGNPSVGGLQPLYDREPQGPARLHNPTAHERNLGVLSNGSTTSDRDARMSGAMSDGG
jgi:hypothetical protein